MRAVLEAIYRAAVAACDPRAVVRDACIEAGLVGRRVVLVAIGKAAPAMAAGACDALGAAIVGGIVVAPDGVAVDDAALGQLAVRRAAHPVPDARSESAGRAVLACATAVTGGDVLLVLVSGGASALCAVPAPGLSLAEKVARTTAAARAGAPIAELNRLRTSLSAVKGGRLAAACRARVVTLVASDVPGDDPEIVGSGPTVPGKPGDVVRVVAGLGRLRAEAVVAARAHGLVPVVRAHDLVGDVAEVQALIAGEAAKADGAVWIAGGEWTVGLGEAVGAGGRATELALRLARRWAGDDRVVLVAGSDGVDGTGPAAGAIIDGTTWHAIATAGVDPAHALARHDSGAVLAAVGATVVTGPTGVNHADLVLVAARPVQSETR